MFPQTPKTGNLLAECSLEVQIKQWFEFWMNYPASFWLIYSICIHPGMREVAEMVIAADWSRG